MNSQPSATTFEALGLGAALRNAVQKAGFQRPTPVQAAVIAAMLIAGIWMYRQQYRKADERLEAWAKQSNYKLLAKESANPFGTGPRARYATNKQVMYRVTISDVNGVRRHGVIKIGSPAFGVQDDDVFVEWDQAGEYLRSLA
jgi:hypothetical protein